jgi:hypothetical protein
MFVAPLLVVLIPIGIVLWPPVLLLLGVSYVVMWPFALLGRRFGVRSLVGGHERLGQWFIVLLRPWRYFDVPKKEGQ